MSAYDGLDTETIFDFETLSQDPVDGVVISMAMMSYNAARFADNPYTYQELLDKCHYIKFNVEDQVKNYNRKIQKDTLEWWSKQNKTAQEKLAPSADDVSISELYSFFVLNKATNMKKVYTRRNTFDPVFMSSLMKATGNPEPYAWWDVRDTISYIEGLVYPEEIKTNFIPEGLDEHFVAHDPSHDITMDIMRIQTIVQAVTAF
jgi:hypothetical protein